MMESVRHHVQEEEQTLFPEVRDEATTSTSSATVSPGLGPG